MILKITSVSVQQLFCKISNFLNFEDNFNLKMFLKMFILQNLAKMPLNIFNSRRQALHGYYLGALSVYFALPFDPFSFT